jgi:hypothetical protein
VCQIDSSPRRLRAHAQQGAGKLKAVAYTAILSFGVFCAIRLLPPYIAEYQLADKMQEQARFAVVNRYTEEQIRATIFKEAEDLDVPITKDQIKVLANPSVVRISLDYTVPIDLLVYKMQLHFTPSSENKSLL